MKRRGITIESAHPRATDAVVQPQVLASVAKADLLGQSPGGRIRLSSVYTVSAGVESHRRDPDEFRRRARVDDGNLAREMVRAISAPRRSASSGASPDISALERYAGRYQLGSAIITVVRNGDHLTISSQNAVEQLWESDFVFRGDGTFCRDEKLGVAAHVHTR